VIAAIQREFPHIRTLAGVVDPIAGAVWRARHQIKHPNPLSVNEH
jgi:hypothetical protein